MASLLRLGEVRAGVLARVRLAKVMLALVSNRTHRPVARSDSDELILQHSNRSTAGRRASLTAMVFQKALALPRRFWLAGGVVTAPARTSRKLTSSKCPTLPSPRLSPAKTGGGFGVYSHHGSPAFKQRADRQGFSYGQLDLPCSQSAAATSARCSKHTQESLEPACELAVSAGGNSRCGPGIVQRPPRKET